MDYLTKVDEFSDHLGKEKKAFSTIKSYRLVVIQFLKFQTEQGKELFNYTDEDIIEFLQYKKGQGNSRASITKAVPAINAFSSFININIEIKLNDITFLDDIEQKELTTTILCKSTQERMYRYAARVYKKRNISMILLFLETGLKLSELVSLNKDDLIKINGNTYISVKHKNKRTLPISESLNACITHTFNIRTDHCEAMFVSNIGKRLSARSIIHQMQRHGNITTQILRDTYIYNLINNDVDTHTIAQLAGVSYIDTFINKFYTCEPVISDEFLEVMY